MLVQSKGNATCGGSSVRYACTLISEFELFSSMLSLKKSSLNTGASIKVSAAGNRADKM